jgi:gamma-glutamyltranspeptidase/glutathione hydrolase
MLSSMTPTILEKDGELHMILGSPGGSTIITAVFQTILNVIEFNMTVQDAVSSSRFHHQWLPDEIKAEADLLKDSLLVKELKLLGHKIKNVSSMNRVDAILITKDTIFGGADPRGDDFAAFF